MRVNLVYLLLLAIFNFWHVVARFTSGVKLPSLAAFLPSLSYSAADDEQHYLDSGYSTNSDIPNPVEYTTEGSDKNAGVGPPLTGRNNTSRESEYLYNSIYPNIVDLLIKYKGRMVCVTSPFFPHCEFYLCGTLHVAKSSVLMVKDIVRQASPNYVVLELCEGRIENLDDFDEERMEELSKCTLIRVIRSGLEEKSFKTLGMGLLTWMQIKASKIMGSKLGGELSVAAKEAYKKGSTVILGDRLYSVTVQRIFDNLNFIEKVKMVCIIFWEIITMNLFKIKDYIRKSETDENFIKDEISRFAKYMPAIANVVISERDEYIAATLAELARVGFGPLPPVGDAEFTRKGKILAVVGAGHLPGICAHLMNGTACPQRLAEISSSSRHNVTWPDSGVLHMVDLHSLYGQKLH